MRLKRLAKGAIAGVSRALAGARRGPRRAVLCYHSIHPSAPYASATPEAFAAQLAALSARCDVLPLARILEPRPAGARPAVAITFDDGYADNHVFAAPILAAHGMTATFFLTAGFVAHDPAVLAHFRADRRCDAVEPLTWAQARELRSQGMEIGAHTWSHPNLALLPRDRAEDELVRSKRVIEQELGAEVRSLAYPYGKPGAHVSAETVRLARSAGYSLAAAVRFRGVVMGEDPLTIPRFFINGGDTIATLEAKIRGDWDAIGWWQEHAPRWVAKLISPGDYRPQPAAASGIQVAGSPMEFRPAHPPEQRAEAVRA